MKIKERADPLKLNFKRQEWPFETVSVHRDFIAHREFACPLWQDVSRELGFLQAHTRCVPKLQYLHVGLRIACTSRIYTLRTVRSIVVNFCRLGARLLFWRRDLLVKTGTLTRYLIGTKSRTYLPCLRRQSLIQFRLYLLRMTKD